MAGDCSTNLPLEVLNVALSDEMSLKKPASSQLLATPSLTLPKIPTPFRTLLLQVVPVLLCN